MTNTTKPALPEPVAYLHDVVAADGEPDQALSFSPDNFPLAGVGGFRSIGRQPLYTQAAIDAAVAEYAQALSSALGWPGGISDPVLDWPTLLRYVAEARAVPEGWEQPKPAIREGWRLLKDATHAERSWPEDSGHENGNYSNTCAHCLREFVGHKRRVACKACAEP